MKKIITIFCLLIICLFVNSICTVLAKEKDEIIPLAVGNEWTYAVYSPSWKNDTITKMKITGDTIIKGEKWYNLNTDDLENVLCKNDGNGLWQIVNKMYVTPNLALKYPAKVNEEYKANIFTIKILSIDNDIEVLAGKFNCYSYLIINDTEEELVMNISPGIGIIKMINKNLNEKESGREDFVELKSYKLK